MADASGSTRQGLRPCPDRLEMLAMPTTAQLAAFISDQFGSVWALELLLFLKDHAATDWPNAPLVEALRASDAIVTSSVEALLAGGLILTGKDGARYAPASGDLGELVEETAILYARKPDAVRSPHPSRRRKRRAMRPSHRTRTRSSRKRRWKTCPPGRTLQAAQPPASTDCS